MGGNRKVKNKGKTRSRGRSSERKGEERITQEIVCFTREGRKR